MDVVLAARPRLFEHGGVVAIFLSVSRQSLMEFGRGALQGGHVRKCMRRSRFRTNQRPKLPRPCRLRIGRVNARALQALDWRAARCSLIERGAAACWGCFF